MIDRVETLGVLVTLVTRIVIIHGSLTVTYLSISQGKVYNVKCVWCDGWEAGNGLFKNQRIYAHKSFCDCTAVTERVHRRNYRERCDRRRSDAQ